MNSEDHSLEKALDRFNAAIDKLEAAALRRQRADRTTETLEGEIRTLTEDRSRLAQELDDMRDYAQRIGKIQNQAGQRLDSAMDSIRTILEAS